MWRDPFYAIVGTRSYSERPVTLLGLHDAGDLGRPAPHTSSPDGDSLHGEVLSRLRDSIVEGRLPPGARVPERELCAELGVSRTPLREALKVLAAEGLVELFPNRGARVRQFTATDVREFFELLAALESAAGRPRSPASCKPSNVTGRSEYDRVPTMA